MSIGETLFNQVRIGSEIFRFRVKEELQNPQFQKVLKTAKENHLDVFCLCNDVKMQIKRLNDRFYLSSFPNRKKHHSIFCEFYGLAYDFYKKEKDKIIILNINLFLNSNKKAPQKSFLNKEIKKFIRFSSLILNLLDKSYSEAFNFKNRGKDRTSGNLQNPEFKLVLKIFVRNFINLKMRNGYDFYKTFKEVGLNFKVGKVYYYGEDFIKTKTYFKDEYKTETIKIKEDILKKALKNTQIFKNKITTPYFFFLVKKKRTVQRLFLYPVVESDYFLPIESEFEREKVKKFSEKYCVYKPILVDSINLILTKKYSKIYNKNNNLVPRPDLFVFTKDEIVIVEIAGMENDDYIQRLIEKEQFYKSLEKPFKYGRLPRRKN
jgi:hypothetical protein